MTVLHYGSNNSGGDWWLSDRDWFALEDAGWVVHWIHPGDEAHGDFTHPAKSSFDGMLHKHSGYDATALVAVERPQSSRAQRWRGALATSASKRVDDVDAAIAEWERITVQDSAAEGCNCCGPPHGFSFVTEDGKRHYSTVRVIATRREWQ